MYLEHFHLREKPFSITPDTSYFFQHRAHQEALNVLLVSLQCGEGFIKITGEVGTGKTLLCRKLLNSLADDPEYVTAYIPNPNLTPAGLHVALADELQLDCSSRLGQHKTLKLINERLIALAAEGKRVVLCIDEAQAMPQATMETLRLLSNLETEKSKLLHIVMFGQPELDRELAHPGIRQLRQRITFSHQLKPLDKRGVHDYVRHRLIIAGYAGEQLFSPAACDVLYKKSAGIPRLVNILANKAMLLAYGKGLQCVKPTHVRAAAVDTNETGTQQRHFPFGQLFRLFASTASLLLVVGLTVYAERLI